MAADVRPLRTALSDAAIERIEKIRNGRSITIWPSLEYALISPGTAIPDSPQPQRPIRVPWPGQPTNVRVDAHQWVQDVLEPWQLGAAVSLVVALPAAGVTNDHRTVVSRLQTAKQLLKAGKAEDLKASVAASREARPVRRTASELSLAGAGQWSLPTDACWTASLRPSRTVV